MLPHSDRAERVFSNASNEPLPKASWVCSLRITVKVNLGDTLPTSCLYLVWKIINKLVYLYPNLAPNTSFKEIPKFRSCRKCVPAFESNPKIKKCSVQRQDSSGWTMAFDGDRTQLIGMYWVLDVFVSFLSSHYHIVSKEGTKIHIMCLVFLLLIIM